MRGVAPRIPCSMGCLAPKSNPGPEGLEGAGKPSTLSVLSPALLGLGSEASPGLPRPMRLSVVVAFVQLQGRDACRSHDPDKGAIRAVPALDVRPRATCIGDSAVHFTGRTTAPMAMGVVDAILDPLDLEQQPGHRRSLGRKGCAVPAEEAFDVLPGLGLISILAPQGLDCVADVPGLLDCGLVTHVPLAIQVRPSTVNPSCPNASSTAFMTPGKLGL